MARRVAILIELDIPAGLEEADMLHYVVDAVGGWSGQFIPGDHALADVKRVSVSLLGTRSGAQSLEIRKYGRGRKAHWKTKP